MTVERWQRIISTTNALKPDLILLLGDYIASHRFSTGRHSFEDVAGAAQALSAPLGRYAITGNHDWWEDKEAQRTETRGPIHATRAFEAVGIPMLENRALRLEHNGIPFWLSGTSSMIGIRRPGPANFESRADLAAALAHVTDDAPIIHMAHEPDLFVDIPERVALTVSGHTHGGQVRLFGYSPIVPSMYDQRFAYGHIVEGPKHLVVSGGLGCSIMPLRFGVPPEITLLELG